LKKTTLSHIITEKYYYLYKGQSWGSTQLWTNAKFGKGIYLLESKSGIRGGYIALPRKKKLQDSAKVPHEIAPHPPFPQPNRLVILASVVEYTSVQ
jgi:hypothetical protein